MGIGERALIAGVDFIKKENVQDKTVSLLGLLFPYVGIEKRALDMYVADVEKSDMPSDSKLIAVLGAKKTIKKLKNQKGIAEKAISNAKEGTVFDSSSGVSQEWFDRFMDSAGFVSDEKVQLMWGKMLAGEFEIPGSTPLNMIRILTEITPEYAQAFQKICSMRRLAVIIDNNGIGTKVGNDIMVPYEDNVKEMNDIGLSFSLLNELETLGLIKFDVISGFVSTGIPDKGVLTYVNGITKEIVAHAENELPFGNVMLTSAGICLRKITEANPIASYEALEKEYMIKKGVVYKEPTEYRIIDNGNEKLSLRRTEPSIASK